MKNFRFFVSDYLKNQNFQPGTYSRDGWFLKWFIIFQSLRQIMFIVRVEKSFWPKSRDSVSTFLCQNETSRMHNLPTNHRFLLITMSSMHEDCDSLQFHDVTLNLISDNVCILA